MTRYRKGEFLTALTANRAEEAYEFAFGSDHGQRLRHPIRFVPGIALDKYSVIGLGATSTAYSDPPVLKANDPLSESTGPYYTNGETATLATGEWWFYPIEKIPVKLRVSGSISTGDRGKVTDTGAIEKGSGPVYCCSEVDNEHAYFVGAQQQTSKILLFTCLNPSATGSSTAENTFIYDVFFPSDPSTAILESVSPIASPHLHQRHGPGKCKPAKSGAGYINSNGDWVITYCNEVLITGPCDDTAPADPGDGGTTGTCTTSTGTFNATPEECTAAGGAYTPNPGGA